MATVEQCRAALEHLAEKMGGARPEEKKNLDLDRSLSVHISDLDVTFLGRLRGGELTGITTDATKRADIRLTTSGDDLLALTAGRLGMGKAWASGRLRIDASVRDLLRLRTLM